MQFSTQSLVNASFLTLVTSALAQTQDDYTHAEQASQKLNTWYKSDIGLWGYETGWWNSANCLTANIDLALADGNVHQSVTDQLATTFANAQQQNDNVQTVHKRMPAVERRAASLALQRRDDNKFLNHFYDDEGWWALAWLSAYDLTQNKTYLDAAAVIVLDQTHAWPTNCSNGGVWWNRDHSQVNAIANELFIAGAAGLAVRDDPANKQDWISWATKGWQWLQDSGLINSDNLINDHLNDQCQNGHDTTVWSYNQGVILGGLIDLSTATGDQQYLQEAQKLATASLGYLADDDNVVKEPGCEKDDQCNDTSDQFKGAYIRNLVKLHKAAPSDAYKQVLVASGQSVWQANGGQVQLHDDWANGKGDANTATQSSALEALVGLLQAGGSS